MRFNLRLTNPRRVRWLLAGWIAFLPITLLLAPLHLGWLLLVYYLVITMVPLAFYNKLLRQPAWVLIAADGVAWANPVDSAPVRYQFAELRAYRFASTKNDSLLILYPQAGNKISISGRLHEEFWTMKQAFGQAVKQFNQAHPGAEVVQEPDGLTRFFTSPLATRVLWSLLALAAAWVGWGIAHDVPGIVYLPLLLVGLPYLLVWANFYHERS